MAVTILISVRKLARKIPDGILQRIRVHGERREDHPFAHVGSAARCERLSYKIGSGIQIRDEHPVVGECCSQIRGVCQLRRSGSVDGDSYRKELKEKNAISIEKAFLEYVGAAARETPTGVRMPKKR